jgi:hypothetical protein
VSPLALLLATTTTPPPTPHHRRCAWPLFALTRDGHALTACYDSDTIGVYRVSNGDGSGGRTDVPFESMREAFTVARPFGIERIGAIVMDPTGSAFSVLDRGAKRVVTFPWPLERSELESLPLAYKPRSVEGIVHHA